MQGLLIIGHGTRDAAGRDELRQLAVRVATLCPALPVQACFLELADPDIETGAGLLRDQGARQIIMAPLLLFSAGHARRDLPAMARHLAARWPDTEFRLARTLDCHPKLVRHAAQIFSQLVVEQQLPLADTVAVYIGRGSRDRRANAEMARFARLCVEQTGVAWHVVGFTALAEPSLEQCVNVVGRLPFSQVVVQPHLLFRGALLDRVQACVEQAGRQFCHQRWFMTRHLGPGRLVAEAFWARAAAVWPVSSENH